LSGTGDIYGKAGQYLLNCTTQRGSGPDLEGQDAAAGGLASRRDASSATIVMNDCIFSLAKDTSVVFIQTELDVCNSQIRGQLGSWSASRRRAGCVVLASPGALAPCVTQNRGRLRLYTTTYNVVRSPCRENAGLRPSKVRQH